jgi:hypothetical protein
VPLAFLHYADPASGSPPASVARIQYYSKAQPQIYTLDVDAKNIHVQRQLPYISGKPNPVSLATPWHAVLTISSGFVFLP